MRVRRAYVRGRFGPPKSSVYVDLLDGDLGESLDSAPEGASRLSGEATDTARDLGPAPLDEIGT